MRDWSKSTPGFEDVFALLPEDEESDEPEDALQSGTDGFVYLMASGAHFKIGRSDQIERRLKEITVALPDAVELIHSIRTDDPPGIEAYPISN